MIRKISFSIISFNIFLIAFLTVQEPGIQIEIKNLRNNKGHVLLFLFKDGEGYPNNADKALKKVKLTVVNNIASVLFKDLPEGNYAISVLHDENDDLKMNKTVIGLPKEGYGFSNNVMGAFGPPSYSKASFKHSEKGITKQQIKIKY